MNTTLVVLAAGMASRYGRLKQIDRFGPSGESIIDYSIFDAIAAGFNKVVFVIRRDFEADFKNIFEPRIEGLTKIEYVYQELDACTDGFVLPASRTKPWGTAHAVLCAATAVHEPFAVINADDFYGRDAFNKACDFLTTAASADLWANICYSLPNTLSDYGAVSRGVCATDEDGFITSITERTKIYRHNAVMVYEENGSLFTLSDATNVSMNFWCFTPEVFDFSKQLFTEFLKQHAAEPKSEFFIPFVADEYIRQGRGKLKAIPTHTSWFGVTYKEDKQVVQSCINGLVEQGSYPLALWVKETV
ncbi:MAG TPA: sugar phosphate nucleotidyltransferase [Ferruginibacter sp.]|nr:sugar phosphate nucleotidyltransferase [Ferruginibacter sp.]HMP22307.1 sugar phosphate nucleotidyltransferase [Ferruginibacter sp.]